jgi:hypothetical protein
LVFLQTSCKHFTNQTIFQSMVIHLKITNALCYRGEMNFSH